MPSSSNYISNTFQNAAQIVKDANDVADEILRRNFNDGMEAAKQLQELYQEKTVAAGQLMGGMRYLQQLRTEIGKLNDDQVRSMMRHSQIEFLRRLREKTWRQNYTDVSSLRGGKIIRASVQQHIDDDLERLRRQAVTLYQNMSDCKCYKCPYCFKTLAHASSFRDHLLGRGRRRATCGPLRPVEKQATARIATAAATEAAGQE